MAVQRSANFGSRSYLPLRS